jgi:putative aminopeptidase FrvX
VIEAHSDEISWFVHFITKEGFIYLRKNGGSDPLIAPSKRVNIFTDKGIIKGIFGWPAIHMRNLEKDTMPALSNIFIDIGCKSKEEAEELGVQVGDVVTFEDELIELNNKYFVGRALDNRIGGFMIAEVLKKLKYNKIKLPYTLYVVNSVQEEIGLRGAEMIARNIKPDVAIITDVCHDTQSPMVNKISNGDLSMEKGPVLTIGPAVQRNLFKLIEDIAKENNILTQRQAVSRATGTDTDAFAYAGAGVVSALISLPLRYMHTTVEMVSKRDIQAVIDLIYNTLIHIEKNHDFKYIQSNKEK